MLIVNRIEKFQKQSLKRRAKIEQEILRSNFVCRNKGCSKRAIRSHQISKSQLKQLGIQSHDVIVCRPLLGEMSKKL